MTEGEASGAENRGARLPLVTVVVLVATCAGIYVISQFLRGSIGVIAPNLARELSLNAAEIGLLSSLFFLMFAAAQLPLGIALDRFGPRACLLGSVSLAIAGSLLFALAGNFAELLGARLLMGLGCAALLVAPLAVYARWFPPDRFSTLLGIQMAVGSLGALLATAPLARAAEAFGWRTPFLVVAAITVAGAVLAAVVIRDNPPGKAPPHNNDSLADSIRGVAHVIRIRDVWRLFLLHTCAYAMYASIQGLWGGPYLTDVYGFDLAQRGDMLLLMAVAQICGSFLWGISDRLLDSYRWPTMIGAIGSALLLLVLPLAGPLPQGLAAGVVRRLRAAGGVHAGDDGARQVAVPAASRRARHHLAQSRQYGRGVRLAGGGRRGGRSVSHHQWRLSGRGLSHGVRPAGAGDAGADGRLCRGPRPAPRRARRAFSGAGRGTVSGIPKGSTGNRTNDREGRVSSPGRRWRGRAAPRSPAARRPRAPARGRWRCRCSTAIPRSAGRRR